MVCWLSAAMERPGNPVKALMAGFARAQRWRQARADVCRALLSATLAVRLDGRDALKDHADPAAGGPFEYAATPAGFYRIRA
jgi:hypothetical protein